MPAKLNCWGNSIGFRRPQYVVERTGLAAGDYLYIRLPNSGEITIRPVKTGNVQAATVTTLAEARPSAADAHGKQHCTQGDVPLGYIVRAVKRVTDNVMP
ncbi:AbrB/MazE/SpoVT family DNA-binding domain-containing protein [Cupriavidus sp. 8B]